MSAQQSIFCGCVLISELASDPDLLPLVGPFVDRLDEKLVLINRLFQMQEWDELSRLAHQLKGSAGGYGYPTISDASGRLEDHVQSKSDGAILRSAIDELAGLCQAAISGREIVSVAVMNAGGD